MPNAGSAIYTQRCASSVTKVDHVFFIDGDQQGSWLLTINKGYNAAALSGDGSIPNPITPFASALPLLQQTLYTKVKTAIGLDPTSQGVQDQTPQSPSIQAHDQVPIPSNVDVYNFYGDVQIRMGVTVYGVPIGPGAPTLNLGDFLMLAQNNSATNDPLWGGGGLCDGCSCRPRRLPRESAAVPQLGAHRLAFHRRQLPGRPAQRHTRSQVRCGADRQLASAAPQHHSAADPGTRHALASEGHHRAHRSRRTCRRRSSTS